MKKNIIKKYDVDENPLFKEKNKKKCIKIPYIIVNQRYKKVLKKDFGDLNIQFKKKYLFNDSVNNFYGKKSYLNSDEKSSSSSSNKSLNELKNKITNNFNRVKEVKFKRQSSDSKSYNLDRSEISEYYIDEEHKLKMNNEKINKTNLNKLSENSQSEMKKEVKEKESHQIIFKSTPNKRFSQIFPISKASVNHYQLNLALDKTRTNDFGYEKVNINEFTHNTNNLKNELNRKVSILELSKNKQTSNFIKPTNVNLSSISQKDLKISSNATYNYLNKRNSCIKVIEEKKVSEKRLMGKFSVLKVQNKSIQEQEQNIFSQNNDENKRFSSQLLENQGFKKEINLPSKSNMDIVKYYENQRQSLILSYVPVNYKKVNDFENYKFKKVSAFNSNLTNTEKDIVKKFVYKKIDSSNNNNNSYSFGKHNPFYNFRVNELRNNIFDIYEEMKELEIAKKKILFDDTKETSRIICKKIEDSKLKNDIDENSTEFNLKFNKIY